MTPFRKDPEYKNSHIKNNFPDSSLFDFLQWDLRGGVNLFSSQTAYESLPYLLNFKNESRSDNRRILVETTDSLFDWK